MSVCFNRMCTFNSFICGNSLSHFLHLKQIGSFLATYIFTFILFLVCLIRCSYMVDSNFGTPLLHKITINCLKRLEEETIVATKKYRLFSKNFPLVLLLPVMISKFRHTKQIRFSFYLVQERFTHVRIFHVRRNLRQNP